jgi:eukaryotic-like serine/threonine-protein kinase
MTLFPLGRDADQESVADAVAPGDELLPGHVVVALMRRGGRLDTYDAYSRQRDCRCVIKVIRPDREHEDHCRRALIREGQLLRELAHPHLVRVYEVRSEPRAAVVMETLTGATLAALIEDAPLAPRDAALLGRQLASALGYLHTRGWLHLDVKPSNVVVQAGRAVLIDLSLATPPGDGRPHAGTYGYLAPEQFTGRDLSTASDVFGLGVTLGEALTNELPYGERDRWTSARVSRPFRRRLAHVPSPLVDLVHACIRPDTVDRPTLADVRKALDGFLEGPDR